MGIVNRDYVNRDAVSGENVLAAKTSKKRFATW